jgi:mono/diheme cytochrome c family protein
MHSPFYFSLVASLAAWSCLAADLPAPAAQTIDFAKDVQPIFAGHCYECHGEKKQKSDYRLDDRANAMKGGEVGKAPIVVGKSAESPLILRVAATDPDEVMPPKGEKLTAAQVGILRAWIDQGAKWPDNLARGKKKEDHWAFHAPVKPPVPQPKNASWARNEIDRFILTRLEKEGLMPSLEADKVTLLRRLSLDLIGLPPTIEEIDGFLLDNRPDAYEQQVERLLKSPHYGERWSRHWLDAARYADSDGFEKDMSRNMYPYRDYVINAFNKDLPYNQFIIDQLAGDQEPNHTQEQVVATGFLRNSMRNEEGGIDPEQFRMEGMFDRMDAIGKSMLGLTIQCCQCHNHKYDPFTQEDYYRIFAFINNDHEPMQAVYAPDELMKRDSVVRQIREIEGDLQHKHADWAERMAKWEDEVKEDQPKWTIIQPVVEDISTGGQRYLTNADGSFLAQGYKPTKHTVKMEITVPDTNITAFRLELLNDPELPLNGPGRSFKGSCALTEFNVEASDPAAPTNKHMVKFASATADYENAEAVLEPNFDDKSGKRRVTGSIKFAIDGDDLTAWGIDAGPGRRNQERKAVFVASTNIGYATGTKLVFMLKQNHGGWNSDEHMNNNLGRFRLSITSDKEPKADPLPKRVRDVLAIPRAMRSPAQIASVFRYWRALVPDFKEANEKIDALYKEYPEGTTALTLLARADPRDTKVLLRGDFLKPTKSVKAGTPSFLNPLPEDAPPTRLTFAKWLVDPKAPTTARVLVNRLWMAYFGQGIVTTPEDFGTQSEAPTHPELLDWLATEFMDRDWSIKAMHRLIVNSATYRQSSRVTPELYDRDPYDRLLARGARFRVEGEIVRDITLAASGLLTEKIGGPSIFAPAPPYLFLPPASYAPFTWTEATGPDRYRRAVYTFRRRSTPYPFLQTFDTPNGDSSCVRRLRSNTPLQALMTLNETVSMECAQNLARLAIEKGGKSDEERLTYIFRRAVSRKPTKDELADLMGLMERQQKRIADGWVNPYELATGKNELPAKLPSGTTPTQLAAYTVVSRVALNLDETITKE